MTMIEKVARAMAATQATYFSEDEMVSALQPRYLADGRFGIMGVHMKLPDTAYCEFWKIFIPFAKAAIETMRNAVPVIRENGEMVHELRGSPADIWKTMIDGALSE